MPRLLVFAPCEKVIVSQDENTPTLISVLTGIHGILETSSLPINENSVMPLRWAVFAMWKSEPGDESKEFEQAVIVKSPTGRMGSTSVLTFKLDKAVHRSITHMDAVPIGEKGEWAIELYLAEKGAPRSARPIAIYPMDFALEIQEPPQP